MNKFTLGADPEFYCSIREEVLRSQELGLDGNGITLEIRPQPSEDPLKVVSSIHQILLRSAMVCPSMARREWVAKSYYNGYKCGGHIHFGTKCQPTREVLTFLDCYLGAITILLEKETEACDRRCSGDYGMASDYRTNGWGFEYRTPSTWIGSPIIAAGVLSLAKVVFNEVVTSKSWKEKLSKEKFAKYVRSSINYGEYSTIREHQDSIISSIKKMSLYKEYSQYIDNLFFLINNRRTWHPKVSMQKAWGIDLNKNIKVLTGKQDLMLVWKELLK